VPVLGSLVGGIDTERDAATFIFNDDNVLVATETSSSQRQTDTGLINAND
jgi:hypothetical protein